MKTEKKFTLGGWAYYISMCIYALAIAYAVSQGLFNPNRNWDMLCYMGSVVTWSTHSPEIIYNTTMAALKANVPGWIYTQYSQGPLSANARVFVQQIPFCQVKPLYNLFLWLFHLAGMALPVATWVTSTVSFAILATLLFLWRPLYLPRPVWLLSVIGLTFLGVWPMAMLAQLSTPDALCTLLTIAALFSWLRFRSLGGFCALGLLSTFARPDAIIPIGAFTAYFATFAPQEYRMRPLPACIFIATLLISAAVVKHAAQGPNYTYEHFFIYSFIQKAPNPAEMTDHLSWNQYWQVFSSGIYNFFHIERNIILLALTALGYFCHYMRSAPSNRLWAWLLLVTWGAWGMRFILWPEALDVRFYYSYCLVILLASGELIAPYATSLSNSLQAHRKQIRD